ncbi:hypothetical protein ACU4GD_08730 [Cupriavidus basilensis]
MIGLMEIENNGYGELSAIHRLTGKLGPDWRCHRSGREKLGRDSIKVALVYNARAVEPAGKPATLGAGPADPPAPGRHLPPAHPAIRARSRWW